MFAIIGGNPAQFKPLFDYYKDIYEQSGHDMARFEVGVHVHAFLETIAKRWESTITLCMLPKWIVLAVRVAGLRTSARNSTAAGLKEGT